MKVRELIDLLRVTPTVALLYSLTSVIAVCGSYASSNAPAVVLLTVATVVTVVASTVALGVQQILREAGVRAPVAFGSALVCAGLARGVALLEGLSLIGARIPASAATLLVNSVVSIVVWMTLIGMFEASRERYRRRYCALLLQAQAAAAVLESGLDEHPEMVRLKLTLTDLTEPRDTSQERAVEVASVIRSEIENSLRPLSHRIWFSAMDVQPHARIGLLLRDALVGLPAPIPLITGVWFAAGISGGISLFGFSRGVLSAVLSSLLLAGCLLAARALVRPSRIGSGVVALVACAVIPIVGTDVLLALVGFASHLGSPLTAFLVVALGTMILGASAIALAASDRSVILGIVESRVAELEAAAHEGLRGTPAELAAFLHNSLQSELHGLALQLDEAGRLHDDAQARAALERLGALAQRSLSEDFRSFRESPLDRLARIEGAWEGIVDLRCHLDSTLAVDDARLPLAVRAVEEVVANAVRHGGARSIDVSLGTSSSGNLAIDVRSDGRIAQGDPGLGGGWLAAISQSQLLMDAEAGGVIVHLEI